MSSVINTSNTTQSSINIINTQSTDTQSSNVSTTTTITSISTTTTSSILLTTTTPITTTTISITTSNSFFTDTNSNSFTTINSKNFPTTVSGTVPSISTLIPEENINSDENNNDVVIFGAVFGTILLALFGCIFLIYFIRRKKDKENENVLVYNPNRSSGLIDNSGIIDIQKTTVQPQNRSSNYAGEIVELVEITDYNNNNTQSNLFVPFNNVSNSNNLNTHQIQQNNELQNMYNNTVQIQQNNELQNMYNNAVQMNLFNNTADDGIKFAETMNRDSLENNNYKNKNNSGITRSLNLPV